jgi:hypothetical protein
MNPMAKPMKTTEALDLLHQGQRLEDVELLDLETQELGFRDALLLTEIDSVWMNAFTFSLSISVFLRNMQASAPLMQPRQPQGRLILFFRATGAQWGRPLHEKNRARLTPHLQTHF